jgi:ribonuclease HII/Holliday junction resolvase-like predicted endonuclease
LTLFEFDKQYRDEFPIIVGIDEAGRGPLAGPVVASAVILPPNCEIEGVNDSKKLSEKKRERLFDEIYTHALKIGVGIVHEREIDEFNILGATVKAMKMAVAQLNSKLDILLVDGPHLKLINYNYKNIIKGDEKSLSIASASIIAKVTRDRIMKNYDLVYPEYHFAKNKGYGTKAHMKAIFDFKSTPIHRKSFKPVSEYLPSIKYLKDTNKIGRLGEQFAASGIIKLGYQILEMNYNVHHVGEIDIIHKEDDELVFSEVKTQMGSKDWGNPLDQIDERKRDKIIEASNYYIEEKEFEGNVRFDVISVQFNGTKPVIKRLKDGLSTGE